jgi:uncharacterized membrane protein
MKFRRPARIAILLALLAFALMGGFFYAYSVSVMPGLDRIEPVAAIRAMQGINAAVRNPVFFVTYFLTPVFAAGLAIALWAGGERAAAVWLALAAAVYGAGVLGPTGSINVPMNEALALVTAEQMRGNEAAIWTAYSDRWTLWNNVRGGLCLAAAGLAGVGLARLGR